MHLVVAGATGGTGKHVVERALAAGHTVTALSRSPRPAQLPEHESLAVAQAEVLKPGGLKEFPEGVDAVVSALGLNDRRDPTPVCYLGAKNLVAAMRAHGCSRLLALSAAPVLREGGDPLLERLITLPIARWIYRRNYADLANMEDFLRGHNDIRWTVLRPGRLLDSPGVGSFRIKSGENVSGSITRSDLADAVLSVLMDPTTIRCGVGVGPA